MAVEIRQRYRARHQSARWRWQQRQTTHDLCDHLLHENQEEIVCSLAVVLLRARPEMGYWVDIGKRCLAELHFALRGRVAAQADVKKPRCEMVTFLLIFSARGIGLGLQGFLKGVQQRPTAREQASRNINIDVGRQHG